MVPGIIVSLLGLVVYGVSILLVIKLFRAFYVIEKSLDEIVSLLKEERGRDKKPENTDRV